MTHTFQHVSTDRRHLLRATCGLGTAMAAGLLTWPAQAAAARTRIDMHAHLIPDFYRQAMADYQVAGDGGIPIPSWSPGSAVDFMNKFGVQTQMVSLSEPGFGFLPDRAARTRMARQVNEYLRDELVQAGPASALYRRFGGFASLPLGNANDPAEVAAACAEAVRAVSILGLDGIGLYSNYQGVYLGDARLDPLMQVLNELGAYVFVHPVAPPVRVPLSMPAFVLDFPFESTRAAAFMLRQGIYKRYPRIRWQLSHGGGATPFLAQRSSQALSPEGAAAASQRAYAHMFFDTALTTGPASLASLRQATDLSHIMWGSDYPYGGIVYALKFPGDPNAELNESLNPTERQLVDRGNALAQLPGLRRRLGLA